MPLQRIRVRSGRLPAQAAAHRHTAADVLHGDSIICYGFSSADNDMFLGYFEDFTGFLIYQLCVHHVTTFFIIVFPENAVKEMQARPGKSESDDEGCGKGGTVLR